MPNSIKTRVGNIFDSDAGIICHQVNCKGVMGAGLAAQVAQRNPRVFKEYQEICRCSGYELLGRAIILPMDNDSERFIANCFGQYSYGRDRQHTNYTALELSLKLVRAFAHRHSLSVALPYNMGCGAAGGTWAVVRDIIISVFANCSFNVTIWRLP